MTMVNMVHVVCILETLVGHLWMRSLARACIAWSLHRVHSA